MFGWYYSALDGAILAILAEYVADRCVKVRAFSDSMGKMNLRVYPLKRGDDSTGCISSGYASLTRQ